MTLPLRIGIIGGGGWLGGAMAEAMIKAGLLQPADLTLSYRSAKPDRLPQAYWTQDSRELAERSDVIIISVRPADWTTLDFDAPGKLVISVMAGIRLEQLAQKHGSDRIIRSLPNAAAEVRRS